MRIISGHAKGTKLLTPETENTRPTLERVKENYFNAIAFELEDKKVLDLFAGSGQLGLEALSRGARDAVFIDPDENCIETIKTNAQKTKFYSKCNILRVDYNEYFSMLKKRKIFEKFDIVFLDPPFDCTFLEDVIKKLVRFSLINEGCIIICETENQSVSVPDDLIENFANHKIYKYGKVYITVLHYSQGAQV